MRHFHLILRLQLSFSLKDCFDVRMSEAPTALVIKGDLGSEINLK